MNGDVRYELLSAIAELSKAHSEWRLGQMIGNLAMSAGHTEAGAVWDLEDGEVLEAARQLLKRRDEQLAL